MYALTKVWQCVSSRINFWACRRDILQRQRRCPVNLVALERAPFRTCAFATCDAMFAEAAHRSRTVLLVITVSRVNLNVFCALRATTTHPTCRLVNNSSFRKTARAAVDPDLHRAPGQAQLLCNALQARLRHGTPMRFTVRADLGRLCSPTEVDGHELPGQVDCRDLAQNSVAACCSVALGIQAPARALLIVLRHVPHYRR